MRNRVLTDLPNACSLAVRLLLCLTLLAVLLGNGSLFAAPGFIDDQNLSQELNSVFDIIQAERRDKIEYIDHYKILQDQAADAKGEAISGTQNTSDYWLVKIHFFIKTRRGAEENFKLKLHLQRKGVDWVTIQRQLLEVKQTRPPVIRPAKESLPKKELVFDLVRSYLQKQSSVARRYQVHNIEQGDNAVFRWADNYTRTRFLYPVTVKMILKGRIDNDKDYFACKWNTLIEFNPEKKHWVIMDLDETSSVREIEMSCQELQQTFLEKVNDIFPGDKQP